MHTKKWNQRERTYAEVSGVSKTQQSHKDSVDINNLIARFDRTGVLPMPQKQGQYGDVSIMNDNLQVVLDKANMTLEEADTWIEEYLSEREMEKAMQEEQVKKDQVAGLVGETPHHPPDDQASEARSKR